MFKKLRNRMLLLNMTTISIVMIAAFAFIYFITYANIQKENQSKLESIPTFIAQGNFYMHRPNDTEMNVVLRRIPIDYSQSFSILLDSGGEILNVLSYIDLPNETYEQIAKNIWSSEKNAGTIRIENRKWQYRMSSDDKMRMVFVGGEPRAIHHRIVFLDITDSSATLTQLLITFVVVGIAMLFILFGVSFHFASRSIRPLEESWRKQKQFVADASHELKTPIAIIQANTDALLAGGEETVNSQKKWIGYIQSEASRMGKLINDMLYLAKVENTREDQTPFDISITVSDVVASMEAVIFEKGIQLSQEIEPGLIAKGDGEKIKQAVIILLDNAVKYTNARGNIEISLKRWRNHAICSVQNSGEGIPSDQLTRIFDRFYRVDPSRSHDTGGYGLGLSIAKAIIERSNGNIYAHSDNGSNTFSFILQLY